MFIYKFQYINMIRYIGTSEEFKAKRTRLYI